MEAKRRRREPRVADNPMAVIARQVMKEAAALGTADELAAQMEPLLQKLYGNSAIYQYVNERATPPGDVLLAAAVAAGISLDEKLGIGRQPTEVERRMSDLRARLAELSGEVTDLQSRLDAASAAAAAPAQIRESRAEQRRKWARQAPAAPPPAPSSPPTGGRQGGRGRSA